MEFLSFLADCLIVFFSVIIFAAAILSGMQKNEKKNEQSKAIRVDPFSVELHTAWSFICGECGSQNYVSPDLYMPDEDEAEQLSPEFEIEPDEIVQNGLKIAPMAVVCPRCRTQAKVEGFT